MVTSITELDLAKKYTYADYLTWQFDEWVELIKGRVYRMSPAPNLYHQNVSSNLLSIILPYMSGKKCKVFHAPFDVRLPLPQHQAKNEEIETVVQPDICVICDTAKLD